MRLLFERAEALLRDRSALREEAETYLNEAAAAHWIYGKVYCEMTYVSVSTDRLILLYMCSHNSV